MKLYSILFLFLAINSVTHSKKIIQTTRKVDQMILVKITKGEFFFGSDEPMHYNYEKPIITVKMDSFYMDKYEISNKQFNQCIQKKQCTGPLHNDNKNHPVNNITWDNAQKYCKYVDGSLPSEAQWEYAAKSDLSLNFPWGNSLVHSNDHSIITDNIKTPGSIAFLVSTTFTTKINTDSLFGVSHLAGNISEWTLDDAILEKTMLLSPREFSKKELKKRRSENYLFKKKSKYKVVKGASYQTAFPLFQRSSFRTFYPKDKTSKELGFRCVKKASQ